MPLSQRARLLAPAAGLFAAAVLLFLYACLLDPYLHRRGIVSAISRANRVVARTNYGRRGVPVRVQIVYRDRDTIDRVVKAIEAAPRDVGVYDTPVGLYVVEFLEDDLLLETVATCSGLFRCRGRQYRDRSGCLESLVDRALRAEVERADAAGPLPAD